MATTVRVEQEIKVELDKLQGALQHETGERISHSALLARLLSLARRHQGEFLAGAESHWTPPSRKQLARLLSRANDWGVDTDSSNVDEALYGGSQP